MQRLMKTHQALFGSANPTSFESGEHVHRRRFGLARWFPAVRALTLVLPVAGLCGGPMMSQAAAQAIVYSASADLLANEVPNGQEANPNGTWTYGGYDDVASPSRVFTVIPFVAPPGAHPCTPQHENDFYSLGGGFQGWATNCEEDHTPAIAVNATASDLSICCDVLPVSPHKIHMHPGPGGRSIFDDITIRWTAPGPGTVDVTATWIQRHWNPQEANVLVNGVIVFTAPSSWDAGTTYSATALPVAPGDTVDFVLNQNPDPDSGGYACGSTEFDATVIFTAQKSPAEQASELCAVVQSLPINDGLKTALCAKFQSLLSPGNPPQAAACGSVQAFINLVYSKTGKLLTVGESSLLISRATRIRDNLSCPKQIREDPHCR